MGAKESKGSYSVVGEMEKKEKIAEIKSEYKEAKHAHDMIIRELRTIEEMVRDGLISENFLISQSKILRQKNTKIKKTLFELIERSQELGFSLMES